MKSKLESRPRVGGAYIMHTTRRRYDNIIIIIISLQHRETMEDARALQSRSRHRRVTNYLNPSCGVTGEGVCQCGLPIRQFDGGVHCAGTHNFKSCRHS
jgi:hypothetical protein